MKKECDNCKKKFNENDLTPVDKFGEDTTHNTDEAVAEWCDSCIVEDGGKS